MELGVIKTGSTGNSYFIRSNSGKILLLDAGIPLAEMKHGINYEIENTEGLLVTHAHS